MAYAAARRPESRAVVAGLAILLMVCAGSAAAAAAELSRGALIARANTFCAAAKSELSALTGRGGTIDPRSPAAGRAIRVLRRQLNRLKAIRPAANAARRWHAFVRAAATVDHVLNQVVRSPPGDLRPLAMLAEAGSAAAAAGVALGARTCAA